MISVLDGQQGAAAGKPTEKAFVLLVTVGGCMPPIWRRLLVRETMWLNQLHETIQVALDWFDYQTHEFAVDGMRYGNPFRRDDIVIEDDRDVTLKEINLGTLGQVVYNYHFGEGWPVEVRVEKVLPVEKTGVYPLCLGGERAGPPEDCGGVEAYHDMLACIKEPNTDIGREWIEWLGPEYDAERCEVDKINKALDKLGKESE